MNKVKQLESKLESHFAKAGTSLDMMQDKYWNTFSKQSMYLADCDGDPLYTIAGLYSNETRMLLLKFIAQQENVTINQ